MSEKRYIVPEGMLKAALRVTDTSSAIMGYTLEAALRWLAENPVVPSKEQAIDLGLSVHGETTSQRYQLLVAEWQRRCFLAPEPEVPEAVKDLLHVGAKGLDVDSDFNAAIIEAYRRGRESVAWEFSTNPGAKV